jgi:hypothetical protein
MLESVGSSAADSKGKRDIMKMKTLKMERHPAYQQSEMPFVCKRPQRFLEVRHVGIEYCFPPEPQTYASFDPPAGRIELTVHPGRTSARVLFRIVAASPVGFLDVRYEILDCFNRLIKRDETGWIPSLIDREGNLVRQQRIEFPEPNKSPAEIPLDLNGTDLLHPLWLAVYADEPDHSRMELRAQYILWDGRGWQAPAHYVGGP